MMVSRFFPTKSVDLSKLVARIRADLDFFEAVAESGQIKAWREYEEMIRRRMLETHFPLQANFGLEIDMHLAFIQGEERRGRREAWAKAKAALLRLSELWRTYCGPRPVAG